MPVLGLAKRWLPAQLLLLWTISDSSARLFAPETVPLEQHSKANVTITSSAPGNQSAVIMLNVTYSSQMNYSSIITVPEQVLLPAKAASVSFNVTALDVGQVTTYLLSNNSELNSFPVRIRFMVVHSNVLSVISQVIGWIYFVAWSVSFYPQAWENWRRKSVVGLNFDFVALNLTGFIAYSVFNIGLFWVPYIEEEFLKKNPNGINPVSANDVFFSLHAVLLCLVYISQAAVYEVSVCKEAWKFDSVSEDEQKGGETSDVVRLRHGDTEEETGGRAEDVEVLLWDWRGWTGSGTRTSEGRITLFPNSVYILWNCRKTKASSLKKVMWTVSFVQRLK